MGWGKLCEVSERSRRQRLARRDVGLESEEFVCITLRFPRRAEHEEYHSHVKFAHHFPACVAASKKKSTKKREHVQFSSTLLMSSDRWKRRQLAGTRNLVDGISYALSLVESRTAIWRAGSAGAADVDATGSSSSDMAEDKRRAAKIFCLELR